MLKSLAIGAAMALGFAAPAFAACTDISSQTVKFSACLDEQWSNKLEGQGAQEFVYQTADGNFELIVVTEKEAFPAAKFHDAILANAVAGIGGKQDDVKVVSERVTNIDGKPFSVIEYTIPNGGSPILFQNFYYSQPGFGSVQILSFSLEKDATAAAFNAGVFAATVKLGG